MKKKQHCHLILSENIDHCLFQTALHTLEHVRPYPNLVSPIDA